MRPYLLPIVVILSLSSGVLFGGDSKKNDQKHLLIGEMFTIILKNSAIPEPQEKDAIPKYHLDTFFYKSSSSYRKLSYTDRREFAFLAILFGNLDGAAALEFINLIKPDIKSFHQDFRKIPDETLKQRFYVNEDGIKNFHLFLSIMNDYAE